MRALVPTRAEVGFDVDADHAFWYGTIKQTTDGPILYAHPIEPPPPPAPVLRRSEARISIEPPRVRVCREPILNRPDDSYIVVVESAAWSDAMRAIQSYAATAAADYAYIPHTGDTEVVKTREFAEYMESKSNLLLCTPAFGIYCGQYKYTVRCTPTASQQPI
jgi:sugar phosphate isomerase/epimerase